MDSPEGPKDSFGGYLSEETLRAGIHFVLLSHAAKAGLIQNEMTA